MAQCLPFCSTNDIATVGDGTCDVLIVGLEGSGKSLLCRRLQTVGHDIINKKVGNFSSDFSAYTVTTNGIQLTEVPCQAPNGATKLPFNSLILREVGGQMSPLWPQYFEDCRMAIFVVDAADAGAITPAVVELFEMLQHPKMKNKPVCTILNKQDQALVLSRQEIELVMHLADLERVHVAGFMTLELSSIPNSGRADGTIVRDSIVTLLEWMVDNKCIALGYNAPSRVTVHQTASLFVPKWDVTAQVS
ncbi:hypothetical protein CEUSTIGMA_g10283.t1 [Chlamydomonas eustigma]|uniref:ADP-ribosylation factor-like protein 16 n=1 Tax=Chlamydomonas eustigma TaxID=1157962 RepID=A0A250XIE0_9CHLO|nr:hypothetical protein CEUSTIGMA_g10283.t1 [Chlamydomonas eustigma]|eukprot:GAX82857.1 hypothetical protein CEUSTIGMA_g10283.t1 [Chlamydomonas eustigma]